MGTDRRMDSKETDLVLKKHAKEPAWDRGIGRWEEDSRFGLPTSLYSPKALPYLRSQ